MVNNTNGFYPQKIFIISKTEENFLRIKKMMLFIKLFCKDG